MRLSEAIRLGAMLHPQCFGTVRILRHDAGTPEFTTHTCALGAAEEAGYSLFAELCGQSLATLADCPICCDRFQSWTVHGIVVHLNDDHHWTREAIADWVEAFERLNEPVAVAASDPHVDSTGKLTTRDA
jgi:hypothetical protein